MVKGRVSKPSYLELVQAALRQAELLSIEPRVPSLGADGPVPLALDGLLDVMHQNVGGEVPPLAQVGWRASGDKHALEVDHGLVILGQSLGQGPENIAHLDPVKPPLAQDVHLMALNRNHLGLREQGRVTHCRVIVENGANEDAHVRGFHCFANKGTALPAHHEEGEECHERERQNESGMGAGEWMNE